MTQSQPRMPGPRPAVPGYWSYDARGAPTWRPIVTAPVRYMMDPRSYMWHMSQGGNEAFIQCRIAKSCYALTDMFYVCFRILLSKLTFYLWLTFVSYSHFYSAVFCLL